LKNGHYSTLAPYGQPESRPSVQATKASVENLNLLQSGRGEIAFTLGDSLAMPGRATRRWASREARQAAHRRGDLSELHPDRRLRRQRHHHAGGPQGQAALGRRAGSGTELNARAILKAAGITYEDLGKVEYLPFAESVDLMKNRQLDATLQSAGLGVASLRDLANSVAITVVEVPADLVESIGSPYQAAVIPADTYQGQTADVATASVINYLVTRADLDEETVYQMTKGVFEGLDDLAAAHAAARSIKLDEGAIQSPVPLHPGAERYFREQGVM
jgi:uncharacterized protein